MRMLFISAAIAVGTGITLVAAPAAADDTECPSGFFAREVRAYGQRLEAGIDPQTHKTTPEVTQNEWTELGDRRYVVARVCVRPLSDKENDELFWWGTHPWGSGTLTRPAAH